ncbi:hypothetical protein H0H87_004654, partial [Tephrocybe sp. NHM501043]
MVSTILQTLTWRKCPADEFHRQATGAAKSSIMATQLETLLHDDGTAGYNIDDVKGAGAIAYAAGADT